MLGAPPSPPSAPVIPSVSHTPYVIPIVGSKNPSEDDAPSCDVYPAKEVSVPAVPAFTVSEEYSPPTPLTPIFALN